MSRIGPASDTATSAVDPERDAPPARKRPDRADLPLLLLGIAVAIGVRLHLARQSVGPLVVADESAYLSMARHLAAVGQPWVMEDAAAYSIGYSVLISPLFRLFDDPLTVYRSIVVLNALLGGLLVVVLRALVRRLTDVGPRVQILIAAIAACLPSIAMASARAWSDALAPLTFAVLLLTSLRLLERATFGRALLLVLTQVVAHAVHNRFLPLAVVTIAVLAGTALTGRLVKRWAAASIGLLVAGLALVRWVTVMIHDPLYGPGGAKVKVDAAVRVFRIGPLVLSGVGQLWYLVAATAGLAGIGLVHLLRGTGTDLVRRLTRRPTSPGAAEIWTVTAHLLLSIAISVVFMTDRPGAQRLVYGRYNDALIGVLLLIGAGVLLSPTISDRRRILDFGITAAVTTGFAALLVGFRSELLGRHFANSVITGILPFHAGGPNAVNRITVLALGAGAILLLATLRSRWRTWAFAATAIVLLATGLDRLDGQMGFAEGDRHAAIGTAPLRAGDEVRIDTFGNVRIQDRFRYPFFAPDLRIWRIRSEPFQRKLELVLSGTDPTEPSRWGYRMLWADPMRPNAIWLAPGPRQDEADRRGELLPPDPLGPAPGDDDVTLGADLRIEDGHLRGAVTIERPGGGPWMTAGRGDIPMRGRVRVRIEIRPDGERDPTTIHFDIGRFVEAHERSLELPVDLAMPADRGGPVEIELQTVRVEDGPIGAPLVVELG